MSQRFPNNPLSMYQAIEHLNEYLRGWVGCFRTQEFRKLFGDLDTWARNRLRSMQLKKPRKLQRMMIRAGYKPHEARKVWVAMNKWRSLARREVRVVLNVAWFRKQGLVFLDDFTRATPELPFRR